MDIIRKMKNDLMKSRNRIENLKNPESKKKALEVYVELLESLETDPLNKPLTRSKFPRA